MKYDQAVIRLSCKKGIDLFGQIIGCTVLLGLALKLLVFLTLFCFVFGSELKFLSCILNKFTLGLLYICAGAT